LQDKDKDLAAKLEKIDGQVKEIQSKLGQDKKELEKMQAEASKVVLDEDGKEQNSAGIGNKQDFMESCGE
jgi:peptidoglycan hydrolase CwlO-like protein